MKYNTIGTVIRKDIISLIGCAIMTPLRSKNMGSVKIRGIKQSPLRSVASKDARPDLPTLWNIMFPHVKKGRNRQAMH